MAELLIKTQMQSGLRKYSLSTLNLLFPLWGVISPFLVLTNGYQIFHETDSTKLGVYYTCMALWAVLSISCLLLKSAFTADEISVDPSGIKLPIFLGDRVNILPKLAWKDLERLSAVTRSDSLDSSYLRFKTKQGLPIKLPVKYLEPGFVEQLLLATRMWAPQVCDESLEQLQLLTRTEAGAQLSYTELWEEELERRFTPTAYSMLEPGTKLRNGSLSIVRYLASGGLSALYLAQLNDKQLVVLKEAVVPLDSSKALAEKATQMFEREALLLMKVDHPGIVHVLDHFCENGRNYLLLEYVNGTDLRQKVLQHGRLSIADTIDCGIQLAAALKYLHEREQPIIHRDLTPDNVVLENTGEVVLIDFGAANEFIGNATGTFVGKHCFVAPEQLRGKATTQSDIYSLGCTLHFLLTGEEPEALSNSNPRLLRPDVPEELAEIVETCTRLEVAERYPSVGHLLPNLKRLSAQAVQL